LSAWDLNAKSLLAESLKYWANFLKRFAKHFKEPTSKLLALKTHDQQASMGHPWSAIRFTGSKASQANCRLGSLFNTVTGMQVQPAALIRCIMHYQHAMRVHEGAEVYV
jgi:hypothetical protein